MSTRQILCKNRVSYSRFSKYPLKIIRGTSNGPDKAIAESVDGATADKKDPGLGIQARSLGDLYSKCG